MNLETIDFSNPTTIIVLAVLALLIVLIIAAIVHKQRTTARLRKNFGAEYSRAVLEYGSERKAQAALVQREAHVHKLALRPLSDLQRERYLADWATVQSRFVDFPKGAVIEADELVTSLLHARGYLASGFEQGAEEISVAYPGLIENYRSAHAVAVLSAQGEASTEGLRNAMIQYRGLFDELVKADAPAEFHPVSGRTVQTHGVR
jgi:hypothetical protein